MSSTSHDPGTPEQTETARRRQAALAVVGFGLSAAEAEQARHQLRLAHQFTDEHRGVLAALAALDRGEDVPELTEARETLASYRDRAPGNAG